MAEKYTTVPISDDRTVKLKFVDLIDLLIDGQIPDDLTGHVEGMIAATMEAMNVASDAEKAQAQAYTEGYDPELQKRLVRQVVLVSAVEPRIVETWQEARDLRAAGVPALLIAQITGMDQFAIYYAAKGDAGRLAELFLQQASAGDDLEPVPDGTSDAPVAGEAVGDSEAPEMGAVHDEHGDYPVGEVGDSAAQRVGRTRRRKSTEIQPGATAERPKRVGKRGR